MVKTTTPLKKKNVLQRIYARLKGNKPVKKSRDFANNTAILNDTPKNHKPSRAKVVKK